MDLLGWGRAGAEQAKAAVDAGCHVYIAKPVAFDEFTKLLGDAVRTWQIDEEAVNTAVRRVLRIDPARALTPGGLA